MELAFRLLGLGQASRYDTPRMYSYFRHGNIFSTLAACVPEVVGGRPALLGMPRPSEPWAYLARDGPFLLASHEDTRNMISQHPRLTQLHN